jgi:hypothetical protein
MVEELDDDAIERSIAEINEAIRRSACAQDLITRRSAASIGI